MKAEPELLIRSAMWLVAIMVLLIVALTVLTYAEHRSWEHFKQRGSCLMVDKTFPATIQSHEKVIPGLLPNKNPEAWLCNDGVTYWR